jgi:hypothetical protein
MKKSILTVRPSSVAALYIPGGEKSVPLKLEVASLPAGLVVAFHQVLGEALVLLGCLRNHERLTEYLNFAEPSILKALPAVIDFLYDLRSMRVSIDQDRLNQFLRLACNLSESLGKHKEHAVYFDSDEPLIFRNCSDVANFLHELCFDINDYLASTPVSHEWLREHGHGD